MSEYARFYAPTAAGRVLVVYVIPRQPSAPGESCEELQSDFTSKPVKCEALPQAAWETAVADERRWLAEQELLAINDGGCSVIEVVYDKGHHRVIRADCNGEA